MADDAPTAKRQRQRVCLFGLSADPPTGTGGHVGIVRLLTESLPADSFCEIRVLPVYRHTFAEKRSRLVEFHHRMAMCEKAFAGIPRVVVSDAEFQSWKRITQSFETDEERAKVSVGTAALLDYLRATESNEIDFYFCLGADAFLSLMNGKWKESERILQHLEGRFIVLDRATSENNNHPNTALQEKLKLVPGAMVLPNKSLSTVSSTRIREAATLDDFDSKTILPAVKAYILEHRLYGFSATSGEG